MKQLFISFIILLAISTGFATAPTDSVGTSTKNGIVHIIHEVAAGETFYALSKKYGVAVEDIQKANPEAKVLAVGQKLMIPTKISTTSTTTTAASAPKTHTVVAGEGLYSISKKYDVTVEEIVKWNQLTSNSISTGQTLVVSTPMADKPTSELPTSSKDVTHTVAAGEGLYSISKKYGVNVEDIKKNNNMSSDALSVGQVLLIKKGDAPKSPPVANKEPEKPTTTTTTGTTVKPTQTAAFNHPKKVEKPLHSSASGYDKEEEKGTVSLTILPQYNTKFSYGLHKTAPVGTVVKVTNTKTGKIHWVRIMGTLEAGEPVLMKVNQTVIEKLGEGATSFEADISYVL